MLASVVVTALALASPAFANHQFLGWPDGENVPVFGPNQQIVISEGLMEYVTGCPVGSDDFLFPQTDIFVVAPGMGAIGTQLRGFDRSGAHNTVIGSTGGAFVDETIGFTAPAGALGPGRYAVVYDECQDGVFTSRDFLLEPAFRVRIPTVVPPLPSIVALKSRAATQQAQWQDLYDGMWWFDKAWTLYDITLAPSTTIGNILGGMQTTLLGAGGNPWTAAMNLTLGTVSHYRGIAADPPNPDFQRLTPLGDRLVGASDTADPLAKPIGDLASAMADDAALADAFLDAIERYQGAAADEDGAWALVQARAARDYATRLAGELPATSAAVAAVRSALAADSRPIEEWVEGWEVMRADVAANGLPAEVEREARNLGLSAGEVAGLASSIVATDLSSFDREEVGATLDQLQATNTALTSDLSAVATGFDSVIAALETDPLVDDQAPVASAGGPYDADEGAPLTLSAAASTSTAAVVETRWDLDGDGAFDDASGPTAAFDTARPGVYVVGVEVRNQLALADVDYATVTVAETNGEPTIDAFAPADRRVTVTTGASQAFSVATADPEGDAVSVQWLLDGVPAGTGSVFGYSPVAGAAGVHTIEAVASDGPGSTVRRHWVAIVLEPDADGDGWRANLDCADSDPEIPGDREIVGNGSDDDCDASTPDSGSAPVAAFSHTVSPGLVVAFTDASTDANKDIVEWSWDLGDGSTSSDRSPTHAYAAKGSKTVTLTVTDATGNSHSVTATVVVLSAPVASFAFQPPAPVGGGEVDFTDTSTDADGTIAGWSWEFGDGGTSTLKDPTHVYLGPGTFEVTLTVTDDDGATGSVTKNIVVGTADPGTAPTALFRADVAGRDVAATANGGTVVASSGWCCGGHEPWQMLDDEIVWPWATSGGSGSGHFATIRVSTGVPVAIDTVQVQPRGDCCDDQRVRNFAVDVSTTGTADADFTQVLAATTENNALLQSFALPANTTARYIRYRPLTNNGSCCYISTTRFKVNSSSTGARKVDFLNQSTNAVSYKWTFGDGGTSTDASPTHTYATRGTYLVTLVAKSADGRTATYSRAYEVRGPIADFTVDPAQPAVGELVLFKDASDYVSGAPGTAWTWEDSGGVFSTSPGVARFFSGPPGTFTITHTVTDVEGLTDSVTKSVDVVFPSTPRAGFSPQPQAAPGTFSSLIRGRDLALAPTGGSIHSYSSRYADYHPAETLIDGDSTNNWWATANGQTSGWVKIDLAGDQPRLIDGAMIQPRYFGQKVKDFEILVSTTGTADSDFVSVVGPAEASDSELVVQRPMRPVLAKYVLYRALTNRGDPCCVSTNQVRVYTGQESTSPTVRFFNRSVGATSYLWDFGDGTTSTEESPVHTFPANGTYTVKLTASSPAGDSTFTLEQIVRGAVIGHSPAAPTTHQQIDFRDDSPAELGLVSWSWSFGDGTTSTRRHSVKTYAAPGEYTITLTGTDRHGVTHVATKQVTVEQAAFQADFSPLGGYNVASLENGAAVISYSSRWPDANWWPEKLLDAYTGTAWHTAADQRTGTIVFSLAGGETYLIDTFQLLGRQDCCPDQHPRDFEIDVSTTGTADADFRTVLQATMPSVEPGHYLSFSLPRPVRAKYIRYRALSNRGSNVVTTAMLRVPSGQVNYRSVTYDNLSLGGVAPFTYSWDFGDGSAPSTEESPTHTFPRAGRYDVTLTVTDATGATSTQTLTQRILAELVPGYSVAPATLNEAQAATFTDTTTSEEGPIVERRWTWGDGSADTTTAAAATSKTFADSGTYNVRLVTRDAWGQTTEVTKPVVVANVAPTVEAGPNWRWREDRELTTPITTSDVAGASDPVTCSWTYGDGSAAGTGCAFVHTYADPGTYTATVTADDGDGGTATDSFTVTVLPKETPGGGSGGGSTGTGAGKASRDFTYSLDEDFDLGTLLNVNHDAPGNDQLQLNRETKPFPFVYIANSARGTAVRVDVNTGTILGEYWTAPDGRARNPSRTTVDKLGNVYVTNRDESGFHTIDGLATNWGSVTRIGLIVGGTRSNADGSPNPLGEYLKSPFEYNTCVDRDGDGLIRTSRARGNVLGWTNAGGADHLGGASTAVDECIQFYTRVRGTNTRTVAIDSNNDAWIGGANNWHEKLDGDTGLRVPGTAFNLGCGGYGGLIDRNDVLWSARYGNGLLRYDTRAGTGVCLGNGNGDYGLAVDPASGHIWQTNLFGNRVVKLDPTKTTSPAIELARYPHGNDAAQGVAVDSNGSVWVAHALFGATTVGRVRTDGTYLGNAQLGSGNGPTGVAVDANGKVWSANLNSNNATRIDPEIGQLVAAGDVPSGWHDLTVDLGPGAGPYNYSDMTGAVSLGAASPSGFWTIKQDATTPGAIWRHVTWNGSTPDGTSILVEVRAADTEAELTSQPFVAVVSGSPLSGVAGRFLDVRATLQTSDPTRTPVLEDIRLSANTNPVATGASVSTPKDTPVDVTLSATDPDGDALTYAIVDEPAHGDVTLAGAVATYTPDAGYDGPDSFTFEASDGVGDSNVATVSIAVTDENAPPVAPDVAVETPEDTPTAIVLAPTDPDGDALDVEYAQPAHGAFDGTTYTPDANFHGQDSFTYTATDPDGESDGGVVSITVTPVNDGPTAGDDAYAIDEGTSLAIPAPGILANDDDVDGDALSAVLAGAPAHGALTWASDGAFSYQPEAEFSGTDSFTYRVSDGSATSALATVTIEVRPLNDPPVVEDVAVSTDEDTPLAIPLTAADADGDTPLITTTAPASGTYAGGTYAPAPNFHGTDSFTYTADDGKGGSDTATVTITVRPVNDPPVADDQAVATDEDTPVAITLAGSDVDGDTLSFAAASAPLHGTWDGTRYTPAPNYHGPDSFAFVVSDGRGGSDTGTVAITVRPVNDPPQVADRSVTTPQDTPVAIALAGTDADGDTLAITTTDPAHGTYADGVYTPDEAYAGPDGFSYTASDGNGGSDTATVSITVTSAGEDTAPPACALVGHGRTPSGASFVRFHVTDAGLGLARHELLSSRNVTVTVAPYESGAPGPVVAEAVATDPRKTIDVHLRFYDLKGNVGSCDATTVAVTRGADKVQNVSFYKVPGTAGSLTILNGDPGLTSAVVNVNNVRVAEMLLAPAEKRSVELPGLKPGAGNTVTLRLTGEIGAGALIVVGASA